MSARIPVQIGEGGDESALRHLVHINAWVTRRGHPGPDGEFVTGHHDPEGLGVASAGPADGLLSLSVGRTWIAIHRTIMAEVGEGLPPGRLIWVDYPVAGFSGCLHCQFGTVRQACDWERASCGVVARNQSRPGWRQGNPAGGYRVRGRRCV